MQSKVNKIVTWYFVIFIFLVVIAIKPMWFGLERKTFNGSHQDIDFIRTKMANDFENIKSNNVEDLKIEVANDIDKYHKLSNQIKLIEMEGNYDVSAILDLRQRALARKIKKELSLIPESEYPKGSQQFK